MIVYLSGGMRSQWQKKFIEKYPHITFIDPSSHGLTDPEEYTKWDMNGVEVSDLLIAYLEKDNPSGLGMALEAGYALGLGKSVIFVDEKHDRYADIIKHAVTLCLESIEDAIDYLKRF